jgi:aryl-alcohol dehydrogenase-like predicted oxidoreductase
MTDLKSRRLGATGPLVSVVGLGCNNFGREGTRTQTQEGTSALIDEAIELGVTLLDTADIYGGTPGQSETLMGIALRGKRDRVVLATKFGHDAFDAGLLPGVPKGSRRYIRAAIDASLSRLQTDHVDLYQQHVPDLATPIDETLGALNELVDEGKVVHIGCTQFSAEQLRAAASAATGLGVTPFVSAQSEYSLVNREAEIEVLPAVRELGMGFLPFFPLANGLLTGKFTREAQPADSRIMRQRPHIVQNAPWDSIEAYAAWCVRRGVTMLEATFGWLIAQPGLTSVIAGATSPEQLRQNVAAGGVSLDVTDVAAISGFFSASLPSVD